MKSLGIIHWDTDEIDIIKLTDIQYERLERVAKECNMTIQEVIKFMIVNRLRAEKFGI